MRAAAAPGRLQSDHPPLSGDAVRHLHGAGLAPYHANLRKRLIKRPKVYIRDPGLLDALPGLDSLDALLAYPIAGHSWEGMILEQIIHQLSAG